ncbi:MAG: DUF3108 domain-containing protein [Pseudomonadota bacterium]
MRSLSSALPAAMGLALMALPAFAVQAKTTLETKYKVRFVGMSVGKLTSTVVVQGNGYALSGNLKTSGLAKLLSPMTASFSSYGGMAGKTPYPAKHNLSWKGKKSGSVRMNFASGAVASHASTPKVKYKPGTVPLKKAHLRSVMDPISALVFPVKAGDVGKGRGVCNRTVPIFDGKNRFNLTFRHKRTENAKAKGFKGKVHVCSVRYTPVSGHRPHKKNIQQMQRNRGTEVGFARVGNTNTYTMFSFKVPTSRGTARGKATLFKVK